jgi:recombination protein RecA
MQAYGNEVTVEVVKNKVAPPFKTAEFDIEFGRGISHEGEILDLGVKHHLLKLSGSWYSYEEKNFANGKDNAKKYLREHKEFSDTLFKAIKDKLLSMSSEVHSTERVEGEEISDQEDTWEVDLEDEKEIAL